MNSKPTRRLSLSERSAIAERLHGILAAIDEPENEAAEAAIMLEVIAEIDALRAERRHEMARQTPAPSDG